MSLGKPLNQLTDAGIRSLVAICVGFVGFWLPILGADYIERPFPGVDFDDRLGFYLIWTLPIILVYAARASVSQVRAYQSVSSSKRLALAALVGVTAFCWSPIIYIVVGVILRK
jgi:hypothetical protein